MSTIAGVPAGYIQPPAASNIPLGATGKRELRTYDEQVIQLLQEIALTLLNVQQELQLLNQNMFPDVNLDAQRVPVETLNG